MKKIIIFISSVQSEFSAERMSLHDYILSDPLLGKFFDPFLFELLPATDQRTDEVYLREVEYCDIYLGLLGRDYSYKDHTGKSTGEVTGEVTEAIRRIVLILKGEMKRVEIQNELQMRHDDFFRTNYIIPAIEAGMIEMTNPESPTSPQQRYRLTANGKDLQAKLIGK